jgi:hypothetical protein
MTVIAWDGKSIAADKLVAYGDIERTTEKLVMFGTGVLTYTGEVTKGLELTEWFEKGRKKEDWPEFQKTDDYAQLIYADGEHVEVFYQEPTPVVLKGGFHAWGAGAKYAIGAMAAGKTAEEAVIIANDNCTNCGRGVDVFCF